MPRMFLGIGAAKEEGRVVPYGGVEDVEVDSDDLPVLDEVVIPAGLAVLERLLHLLLLPLLLLRIPDQHVDCPNSETGLVEGKRGRDRKGTGEGAGEEAGGEANLYTRLENLAWSHSVFIQFSFCRKRRFMKPLLLSSI